MRKLLLLLFAVGLATTTAQAQQVIVQQDFEDTSPANEWTFTADPLEADFSSTGDFWEKMTALGGIVPADGSATDENENGGSQFWGLRDIENSDNTDGEGILTFAQVDVSAFTGVTISFLYHVEGFDTPDSLLYRATYDQGLGTESTSGRVNVIAGPDANSDGWDIVTINVPVNTQTIDFKLFAHQNGSDNGAWDNVRVEGTAASSDTRVSFNSVNATVTEGDSGTQDVTVDLVISNPSATNATNVTISVGGTADGTDASVGQTSYTFPAGSSANQTVTITVNGDETVEPDENVVLSISSVTGGDSAAKGAQDTYSLEISNDDFNTSLPYVEDFEESSNAEIGSFTEQSAASNADWSPQTDAGNGAESTDGFMTINGFGADAASEDWLISPEFDLTGVSAASASFFVQRSFTGPDLEFNITNNFTGDVGTTVWSSVTVTAPATTGTWEEVSFDLTNINASDFTGAGNADVVMAIKYTSNGTGSGDGAGYSVDQFKVIEGAPQTIVAFENETDTATEGDSGTSQRAVNITATNPSGTAATTATIQVSGTATINDDYTLNYTPDGSNQFDVTFSAGSTAPDQVILITINGDGDDEGNETVIFDIVSVSGGESAAEGTPGTSTLTINNDDAALPTVVINEVDADTPGTDQQEFVELYNTSSDPVSLDGLVLVLFNGSDDASYEAFDLDGNTIPGNDYFVIGNAGTPNVDLVIPNNSIQNGADAVALFTGDATDFPNDTPVTSTNLLDALVYDTNDGDDSGLLTGLGQSTQYNEDENGDKDNHSNSRFPDGDANIVAALATPGATNTNALPVELVGFTAVAAGSDAAVLRWTTASETNNAGFEVQQFLGGTFTALGFVDGRGTTTEATDYSHRVDGLTAGTHRFRLKQVDLDGSTRYSAEVEVAVELAETYQLSAAYPNPFNPVTTFTLAVQQPQDVTVRVYNLLGQVVATLHEGTLSANEAHTFRFEAGSLPSGLYFYQAIGERFSATGRVTLLK